MKKKRSFRWIWVLLFVFSFGGCFYCEQQSGIFYDVKTAYEKGYIIKEDVLAIAKMHNSGESIAITDEIAMELKKDYAKQYPRENLNFNHVEIKEFLGEFSDCLVSIIAYDDEMAIEAISSETIAEAEIFYSNGFKIFVYKKL